VSDRIITLELGPVTLEVKGEWHPPIPGVPRSMAGPGEPEEPGVFEWHAVRAEGRGDWIVAHPFEPIAQILDACDGLIQQIARDEFGGGE
jgi:hypothetical protein